MLKTEFKVPAALTKWIDNARAKSQQVDSLLKAAVNESAQNVVSEAVRIVPVMTGKLASSIKADYFEDGLAATIGSYLPYAAKWEYSIVDHPVKPLGKRGKIIGNTNPDATWGFLRKALFKEQPNFLSNLLKIARGFA